MIDRTTWCVAGLLGCLMISLPTLGNAQDEVGGVDEVSAADLGIDPGLDDSLGDELDELLSLAEGDVEQLSRVKVVAPALQEVVSTVSRQKSTVGNSPAAVFVITNEMIRRSSARSIPEVLRMAPGVEVHRIDSSKWAISIRGISGRFSNKLLVQIDGRSVYTPLFAGVFWDVQDPCWKTWSGLRSFADQGRPSGERTRSTV
jgi:outer membrane receptor protein involved in Fe transport